MFWILSSPFYGDFDDYTIYTDPSKYPHNPQPVMPLPGNAPCTSPVIGSVSGRNHDRESARPSCEIDNVFYCMLKLNKAVH